MAVQQGFDTATAPAPDEVQAIISEIGAVFTCPYIGGPYSGGSGYSAALMDRYREVGLKYALPVYVGQQRGGKLNYMQGYADGEEAAELMRQFQYESKAYVALDLEENTTSWNTGGSLDYQNGWCRALNDLGFWPGVYASPMFLKFLQQYHSSAAFIWVADWIRQWVDPTLHPKHVGENYGLTDTMWGNRRVAQYAGMVKVAGVEVDINATNFTLNKIP